MGYSYCLQGALKPYFIENILSTEVMSDPTACRSDFVSAGRESLPSSLLFQNKTVMNCLFIHCHVLLLLFMRDMRQPNYDFITRSFVVYSLFN